MSTPAELLREEGMLRDLGAGRNAWERELLASAHHELAKAGAWGAPTTAFMAMTSNVLGYISGINYAVRRAREIEQEGI